jgi:hypothetical protein
MRPSLCGREPAAAAPGRQLVAGVARPVSQNQQSVLGCELARKDLPFRPWLVTGIDDAFEASLELGVVATFRNVSKCADALRQGLELGGIPARV